MAAIDPMATARWHGFLDQQSVSNKAIRNDMFASIVNREKLQKMLAKISQRLKKVPKNEFKKFVQKYDKTIGEMLDDLDIKEKSHKND